MDAMNELIIRPPTPEEIRYVLERLRESDRIEAEAQSGLDYQTAVKYSLSMSSFKAVAVLRGEPSALIGVCSGRSSRAGTIWMVGTDNLRGITARKFYTYSYLIVKSLMDVYGTLSNYVMDSNTATKRWLMRLGASFENSTVKMNGESFRRFTLAEYATEAVLKKMEAQLCASH